MKKTIPALFAVLFISGCAILSTHPYTQTHYFDIGTPDSTSFGRINNVKILSFRSDGPIQEKMIFRTSPNSVKMDEFNRWSMPPSIMIKRYMMMLYDSGFETLTTDSKNYLLKGEILQLEADLQNSTANISIHFELFDPKKENTIFAKTFKQQIPVQKVTGEAFAAAVKKGTDNIFKELNSLLNNIQK